MVQASKIISDVQEILRLRQAITEVQANAWNLDTKVAKVKPEATDASYRLIQAAMAHEIGTQISLGQLKNDVLANLNAQLTALEAQYPGLTIEEG